MSGRAAVAVLFVAAVVVWYVTLPPAPRTLAVDAGRLPVRGAIHVHTRRSDGSGTADQIAAAAARAGLKFVVLTDHGNAAREPDRPVYRNGVLCIDAVEISTADGHLVALGLPRSPYPLGGEARDVVEDVHRLGGLAIAAHPESMKPDLRWSEWTAPIDGLEWLNGDSEWRDDSPATLARVLLAYPARGGAALATLLDRPTPLLRRWDALTQRRQVTALAGTDAHARLGVRGTGDAADGAALPVPGYEQVFRTFSVSLPQLTLRGDAAADAAALVEEIRRGHLFTSVDALAAPAVQSLTAASGGREANEGDLLELAGPVALHVRSNAPADAQVRLLRNGDAVATSHGATLDYMAASEPGVYRAEIYLPARSSAPWMLSNPIYVRTPGARAAAPPRSAATSTTPAFDEHQALAWTIENSAHSKGAIDQVDRVNGAELLIRYGLGGTADDAPFVAAAMPAGTGIASADRLLFTARADRPMRVSVELRVSKGREGERWHRSVYLDQMPRMVTVFFDEMTPRGPTTTRRPVLADVTSVLFVVDTVNAAPGSSGQFWIDDVNYAR